MGKIYVIRHCLAQGQSLDAPLTQKGIEQANSLAEFFKNLKIDRIVSSPFLRAIQSIEPLSSRESITIEIDERLSERLLSTRDFPDWYEKLQATFVDMDLKYDSGESSNEAMHRIVDLVKDAFAQDVDNTLIVSHGNIISLLLKYYDKDVDFHCWKNLSNPDVFLLSPKHNGVMIERIWDSPYSEG